MKYIVTCILILCCSLTYVSQGYAYTIEDTIEFPFDNTLNDDNGAAATDIGVVIKEGAVNNSDPSADKGVVQRIMDAFGINYFETEETEQTATFYIKEILNWILAIMGLVALISILRGFYKMLLSKDSEEGYTSAKKIVLNAFLAIIIIGVSRFLVSWFFAIYEATLSTTAG